MELDALVRALDEYFRVSDVRNDDWSPVFQQVYGKPYWREYVEPGYEGKWNGLMVRASETVRRVATCVFPSDRLIALLQPESLLFSEHPVDFADEPGFLPLSRESFGRMKEQRISFYHVHAPLDMHPEISPSLLCAQGIGIRDLDEYFPIADGLTGGAAQIGTSDLSLDALAGRLLAYLGKEIPVQVLTRPREWAGRVAVVAGGGAERRILIASLERGCETYVTGGALTRCRIDFVQASAREFLELADRRQVAVIDATHYGMEKPPQLEMVRWFQERGLEAKFLADGPK